MLCRLLDIAGDGVDHRCLTKSERVVRMRREEGLVCGGCSTVLPGSQFELRSGRVKAGLAGVLVAQPLCLLESRGDLVALDEAVDLLEITDQIRTAKLDFLVDTAGTGRIRINRHWNTPPHLND